MTRNEFLNLLDRVLDFVKSKFTEKNISYGADNDVFHNFRNTAKRVLPTAYEQDEYEAMYRVLLCYQDKHRIALANLGLDEPEFEDRVIDDIVYDIISIAMHREKSKLRRDGLDLSQKYLSNALICPTTQEKHSGNSFIPKGQKSSLVGQNRGITERQKVIGIVWRGRKREVEGR